MPRFTLGVDRQQVDWSSPDAVDIVEHLWGPLEVESAPVDLVVMGKLQGTVDPHTPDQNRGHSEIEFRRQNRLAQLVDIAVRDLDSADAPRAVAKQLQVLGEPRLGSCERS